MFNGQAVSVIALVDLFIILVSYIIMALVFKLSDRWAKETDENINPRWIQVEKFFLKFHVMKILNVMAAFLIIRGNIEIISETLASSLQPIDIFGKINLLLVADIVVFLVWKGRTLVTYK